MEEMMTRRGRNFRKRMQPVIMTRYGEKMNDRSRGVERRGRKDERM